MPAAGLTWLAIGGEGHTIGTVVFLVDHRWRFVHVVWRLLVIHGSAGHFCAAPTYAGA